MPSDSLKNCVMHDMMSTTVSSLGLHTKMLRRASQKQYRKHED